MSPEPPSSATVNSVPADAVYTAAPDGAGTASDPLANQLSPRQLAALQAITGGQSLTAAAESSGVPRRTIYNWLATDPHFRAAYNAWKKELMEFGRGRLLKMTETALDAVRAALEKGDSRLAMTLLKHIGLLGAEQPGQTDQELVKAEMILRRRRDRIDVAKQESSANSLTHGMAGERLANLEQEEVWDAEKQAKRKVKRASK